MLETWQNLEQGKDAVIIGNIDADITCVLMQTDIDDERILDELEDGPLPRIC